MRWLEACVRGFQPTPHDAQFSPRSPSAIRRPEYATGGDLDLTFEASSG